MDGESVGIAAVFLLFVFMPFAILASIGFAIEGNPWWAITLPPIGAVIAFLFMAFSGPGPDDPMDE